MTRLPQITPLAPLRGSSPTAKARRWFNDGVRFRCLGPECGDCCSGKHGPGAVWLGREEIARLANHLVLTVKELRRHYLRRLFGRTSLRERADFDCVFYRPGEGCTVYEARPLQCRTYPFWGRILASRVTWENEAEQCPGIGDDDGGRPDRSPGDCRPAEASDDLITGEEVSRQLAVDQGRYR